MEQESHIAILPSPRMRHFIPIVQLAKRLAFHHNVRVTGFIPTTGIPSNAIKGVLIEGLPANVDRVFLHPVSLEDVSLVLPGIQVSLTVTHFLAYVRQAVSKFLAKTIRLVVVILNHSARDALNIAKELKVSPYIFFPSNALALSLLLHLPKLDKTGSCEYRDLPEPLKFSGCILIHNRDLMHGPNSRPKR